MAGVKAAGAWLLLMAMAVALSSASVAVSASRSGSSSRLRHHEITEVEFEIHREDSGTNTVFGPAPTSNSDKNFGEGWVHDFPVFQRRSRDHESDSKSGDENLQEVGRARGLWFYDSKDGNAEQSSMTVVFTRGEYSGNSLALGGHRHFHDRQFEFAVTGGTGDFRFSTGSAHFQEVYDSDSDNSDLQAYKVRVQLKDVEHSEEDRRPRRFVL